jgi:hypothetical protein
VTVQIAFFSDKGLIRLLTIVQTKQRYLNELLRLLVILVVPHII